MIIAIELIALIACVWLTGKKAKDVLNIDKRSIILGILFGLFYATIIFAIKQTPLGYSVFEKFVNSVGLQVAILYIIYPFVIAISEEFIFRYFIAKHWGVSVASVSFTVLHWRPDFPMPLFILIFFFSLSQSWLFKKTKTIWSPVIAHLIVTYFLLFG